MPLHSSRFRDWLAHLLLTRFLAQPSLSPRPPETALKIVHLIATSIHNYLDRMPARLLHARPLNQELLRSPAGADSQDGENIELVGVRGIEWPPPKAVPMLDQDPLVERVDGVLRLPCLLASRPLDLDLDLVVFPAVLVELEDGDVVVGGFVIVLLEIGVAAHVLVVDGPYSLVLLIRPENLALSDFGHFVARHG